MEAGIFDWDILVANRALNPVHKDVVVTKVDGESTIKHLNKRASQIKLVPANFNSPETTGGAGA